MFMHFLKLAFASSAMGLLASVLSAADIQSTQRKGNTLVAGDRLPEPVIAPASNEAEARIKQFRAPPGFRIELFAAEPMLANPVAFCIDEKNRFFVSETHRYRTSVLDIRHYMSMLEDDLACRTVEDRAAMCARVFGAQAKDLAIESEVLRLVEDRNGDGKADFSSVYADGFNTVLDGIASGALARRGKVWFTNIPELWLLEGLNTNGQAVHRTSLSHGYGVHFSLTGHDMHGLTFGPDGRLYFSFGDRGANVITREGKHLEFPDEGAVFRCNPDGTEMEMFASGLRNPQELAFDDFGNLFTGDNDSDQGDVERWVYVVEDGDSGWRIGYQNNPMGRAGPWNFEKLWVPRFPGQAAYIIPPVTNILDGPSGLTYYPGTGLPPSYDKRFFLCYFKGTSARSGIQSYSVRPSGAGFELMDHGPFVWNCLPPDADFGFDGSFYFADWNEGWEKSRKGRLYRVFHPDAVRDPIVAETKQLMAEGFNRRIASDLIALLGHRDRRVRQEAQFALADRRPAPLEELGAAAREGTQTSRIHAIWALTQIARQNAGPLRSVLPLLRDPDREIRCQILKGVGDSRDQSAVNEVIELIKDVEPRVRYFAAVTLGKLKSSAAVPAIVSMLRENNDHDVYLRHAGVVALVGCANKEALIAAARESSASVRMGVLLAMRRLKMPEIGQFLRDTDELLVTEAARAINDLPIDKAMVELAALDLEKLPFSRKRLVVTAAESTNAPPVAVASLEESVGYRVANANFRLGQAVQAKKLASMAASAKATSLVAAEALYDLGNWAKPGPRDRLVGVYRPLPARDPKDAAEALRPRLAELLQPNKSEALVIAAIHAAENLEIRESSELLAELFQRNGTPTIRISALKALARFKHHSTEEFVRIAQTNSNEDLRREANRISFELHPDDAVARIASVLETGSIGEQQGAMMSLGGQTGTKADQLLEAWLDRALTNPVPKQLQLELFEAVGRHPTPAVQRKFAALEETLVKDDKLAAYRRALFGGNAADGRKIFFERPEASCVRCHKVGGEGGDVGPDLTQVGARQTRDYLLESIVYPNAVISQGFENQIVTLKNGTSYAGTQKSETETELVLNSPEDGVVKIAKKDIQSRERGMSGMPEGMGEVLSRRELRDLVEFLASLH